MCLSWVQNKQVCDKEIEGTNKQPSCGTHCCTRNKNLRFGKLKQWFSAGAVSTPICFYSWWSCEPNFFHSTQIYSTTIITLAHFREGLFKKLLKVFNCMSSNINAQHILFNIYILKFIFLILKKGKLPTKPRRDQNCSTSKKLKNAEWTEVKKYEAEYIEYSLTAMTMLVNMLVGYIFIIN